MKFEFSEIIGLCTEVNEMYGWILRVQESFHIIIYEDTICRHIVLNSELVGGLLYGQLFKTEYTLSDGSTLRVHSTQRNVPLTANDEIINKPILFLSNTGQKKNSNAKTHSEPLHPGAMQP